MTVGEASSARLPGQTNHQDSWRVQPESLGSARFRADYKLRYAYLAGAMYKGIASKEMVTALGKAGLMGFLGTGGLGLDEIASSIRYIETELRPEQAYGMNLLCSPESPELEERTVDLYLRHGVRYVEAAAFTQVTPSLVKYRLKGLGRGAQGALPWRRRLLAKVSRPEVASAFLQPAPQSLMTRLIEQGQLTAAEAEMGRRMPMADEICVEADSGGHTDGGVAYTLMPAMLALRDDAVTRYRYADPIHIGAAGGIGTPHAAAAAFIMGADFVLTGSINQCTVEARMSDAVKDLLETINVQDTEYAPAGDMFESGAKVQVVKKGLFFPARANKLYELYQRHQSIAEIDPNTRTQIQERYFKRSFEEVWEETKAYYRAAHPEKFARLEENQRQKMALIFKWYFVHSTRLALRGDAEQKVDYQIHCGPSLGAFNQWVRGTPLQSWRNRHVADIGIRLMEATAELLNERFRKLIAPVRG